MMIARPLIIFGFCIFCASLTWSVAGANIGWVVILLGVLADAEFRNRLFVQSRKNALFWPWAIYLFISVLSGLAGFDPRRSLVALVRWDLTHALVYFVLLGGIDAMAANLTIALYLIGAAAAACFGLYQVAHAYAIRGVIYSWEAAHGTMHHITYGEVLSITFALCLSLFAFEGRRMRQLLLGAALILIEAALVASQARGAWLAAGIMAVVCFAAYAGGRARLLSFAGVHILLLGGILAGSAKARSLSSAYIDRVGTIFSPSFESNRVRLELWRVGLRMFRDHPLFGLGPGGVHESFVRYHPQPMGGELDWGNLHNLYVHQLAERGLLGFLVLVALFAAMVRLVVGEFRKGQSPGRLCALAVMPGFLIMNLSETSFQHAMVAFSLAWILALAQMRNGGHVT